MVQELELIGLNPAGFALHIIMMDLLVMFQLTIFLFTTERYLKQVKAVRLFAI